MITQWILTHFYTFRFNSLALRLCDVSTEIEDFHHHLFIPNIERYDWLIDKKAKLQFEMNDIRERLGI